MSLQKKPLLVEDWAVVVLGFLIIIAAIAGFHFAVPSYGWTSSEKLFGTVLSAGNLSKTGIQFLIAFITVIIGAWLTGKNIRNVVIVFIVVFALSIFALIISGSNFAKDYNLEAVIFSLVVGLIIGNLVKLPEWFRETLTTEMFVKIGLVLLGTSVLFSDVLKTGSMGLIQAVVVVVSVWYFAYWISKKMKVDDELGIMLASAVSICGVSAAIATAGAIKGDSKKLSYVVSMVLLTAIPMMIFMPVIANAFQFPEAVTGAWLGGTIDTTGAVAASGTLVGEEALKVSTIVKFSQNVLLGIAAFAISVYWTITKKEAVAGVDKKPTLSIIWERFPKFVIGFIAASLLFSFFMSQETITAVKDPLKNMQTLWFVLAFTSIGLETNFKELFRKNNAIAFGAFLIAQLFNIIITLIIAFLLFR
ncbi:MAG: putative sulfate exporter family transporter [Chitinophagaceae bacterium]|nr:putative sulfate exporter family transporter [Chitinophagaceae bacterium]